MLLNTKAEGKKKENRQLVMKAVCYQDGKVISELILNKKKILVGSAPNCDFIINDPSVSFYHACLILDSQSSDGISGSLIDLNSQNGSYISGNKLKEGKFHAGDRLQFGMAEFFIEESFHETFLDQDHGRLKVISTEIVENKPFELPPVNGLQIIDGEYCDIVFDESAYQPFESLPVAHLDLALGENYIDPSEGILDDDRKVYEIFRKSKSSTVEVTVVSSGIIISIDYLPLKVGKIILANKKRNAGCIVSGTLDDYEDDIQIAEIRAGDLYLKNAAGHSISVLTGGPKVSEPEFQLLDGDFVCYSKKTVQVFIRLSGTPDQIVPPPFFGRDRKFKVQAAKAFGIAMGIALLLLLVKPPEVVQEEKIAVVYKRAAKPVSEQNVAQNSNMDTNSGNKAQDQKNPENKMSKDGKPKEANVAPQKEAQTTKAQAQNPKAQSPVPTYKLEISGGLNSFLNSKTSVTSDVKSQATGNSINHNPGGTASTTVGLGKASAEIGNFGSDAFGTAKGSSGTKGLSSKNGSDLLYVEPKTVVLGSMDPDLLRKILQEYLPQFRHCYQQELAQNSEDIKGVVDLGFRIGENGKVVSTDIKARDSRFSKKGLDCMGQVLKIIDFPRPKGGGVVDVRQPLNFFAEKGKL